MKRNQFKNIVKLILETYWDSMSDDEKQQTSFNYFSVGQDDDDVENNYCWMWDGNNVIAKKGKTHACHFGSYVQNYTFKGWYDVNKNTISVVFPPHELNKLGNKKPTEDDIPQYLYDKIIKKFGTKHKPIFHIFESKEQLNESDYFDIGHCDSDICWYWDGNNIISKEGGTHGDNFGYGDAHASFRGWYDKLNNTISVVFPWREKEKAKFRILTLDDIPEYLYKKLISKFGNTNPKIVVFENRIFENRNYSKLKQLIKEIAKVYIKEASDIFDLKEKALQALNTKRVNIDNIEFKINEIYPSFDSFSSRPHWAFKLVDINTNKTVSELYLKHYNNNVSKYLEAEQIYTKNEYERKGLASFLYLYASLKLKKPFKRSKNQSDEGELLWRGKLKQVFNPRGGFINESSLRGEYWIDDSGESWYADGDVGDINHEGMVIDLVRRQVLDDLGVDTSSEEYVDVIGKYYDQIFDNIKDDLNKEQLIEWENEEFEKVIKFYLKSQNVENVDEKLDVVYGRMDGRDYGMKFLGWKRMKGNVIQTETLTNDDIKIINRGIYSAYGDEINDDDDDDEEPVFNIEVNSTRSWYEDIPLSVIEKRSSTALNPYRKRY